MNEELLFTENGLKKIKSELKKLLEVDRPEIIAAISLARSHGDLSENAEYHTAKDRQSQIESKIFNLEKIVANAQLFDPSSISDKTVIRFGATVKISDNDGKEKVILLVGEHEADIKNGSISIASPLGSALLGKKLGDFVLVEAPAGSIEYEIIEINYL